jgi:long-subunit acyl-CoA synthetase (AMP-forming)
MVSAERNKAVEVDIGHPIHNTQIFVLDPDLNPVPNGSKGQIFIGGRGLAIGYLDLPAENNSAFVTENDLPPSQKNIGINRLYATGDLGRFDLSGNLQHLGRKDHQIKLRGFRIEPGEVESAINEIDLVEDSLVVLNENKLLAYCAADEKTINADDIRRKLIEELPQYMIPQLIVILPVFPVTPSGKKDRKRLPSPVEIKQETRKQTNPIDNQTQEQISTLLSEIMSKPNLDLNASFFDLGANSMDIVNLAGRLSALRNQDISPIDAFQYPTICLLGEFIESKGVVLQSESRKQNLSEAKQRLKKRRKKEVNHDKADIS